MNSVALETAIKAHLKEMRERLDLTLALRGQKPAPTQAISRKALRSRSMCTDANTFLNSASRINQISKT